MSHSLSLLNDEVISMKRRLDEKFDVYLFDQFKDKVAEMRDTYRVNLRELSVEDKSFYKDTIRDYRQFINVSGLMVVKDLYSGRSVGLVGSETNLSDNLTPEHLMEHGKNIQDKSLQKVMGMHTTVQHTIEIGKDVAVKLSENTDQIARVKDDVYEIDNMVDRANVIMKRMVRKIASVKILWVMIFMIVVGLGLIIWVNAR